MKTTTVYILRKRRLLGDIGDVPAARARTTAGDRNAPVPPLTSIEKRRILAIVILAFFNIFFWSAFEQAGTSMNLFA